MCVRIYCKFAGIFVTYIIYPSPFCKKDPIPEFKKSISLAKKFKNVEILWASVREPYNYIQAKQLGCQIITIPPSTIEKIENFVEQFYKVCIVGNCRGYYSFSFNGITLTIRLMHENYFHI